MGFGIVDFILELWAFFKVFWVSRLQGKAWISRASRHRPSASKVAEKRPGEGSFVYRILLFF